MCREEFCFLAVCFFVTDSTNYYMFGSKSEEFRYQPSVATELGNAGKLKLFGSVKYFPCRLYCVRQEIRCRLCNKNCFCPWTGWSRCSRTCGLGKRERWRRVGYKLHTQFRACKLSECWQSRLQVEREWRSSVLESVHRSAQPKQLRSTLTDKAIRRASEMMGKWGKWGMWSKCSVTCTSRYSEIGFRHRVRTCFHGKCPGKSLNLKMCESRKQCPTKLLLYAQWDSWMSWHSCSTSCGLGIKQRYRVCVISTDNLQVRSVQRKKSEAATSYSANGSHAISRNCNDGSSNQYRECIRPSCRHRLRRQSAWLGQRVVLRCKTSRLISKLIWISPEGGNLAVVSSMRPSVHVRQRELTIARAESRDDGLYHCLTYTLNGSWNTFDIRLYIFRCGDKAGYCYNGGTCIDQTYIDPTSNSSRVGLLCVCAIGYSGAQCAEAAHRDRTVWLIVATWLEVVLLICVILLFLKLTDDGRGPDKTNVDPNDIPKFPFLPFYSSRVDFPGRKKGYPITFRNLPARRPLSAGEATGLAGKENLARREKLEELDLINSIFREGTAGFRDSYHDPNGEVSSADEDYAIYLRKLPEIAALSTQSVATVAVDLPSTYDDSTIEIVSQRRKQPTATRNQADFYERLGRVVPENFGGDDDSLGVEGTASGWDGRSEPETSFYSFDSTWVDGNPTGAPAAPPLSSGASAAAPAAAPAAPSTEPTRTPMSTPSRAPTSSPSKTPTSAPSKAPTSSPSKTPTSAPSKTPTSAPSKALTSAPSKAPTSAPSKASISAPSRAPTSAPSKTPTSAPSKTPTSAPSKAPTSSPSKALTSAPSKAPTSAPSKASISAPSRAPTSAPSKAPTSAPSKAPAAAPSKAPAAAPSKAPSSSTSPVSSSNFFSAESESVRVSRTDVDSDDDDAAGLEDVQNYAYDHTQHTPFGQYLVGGENEHNRSSNAMIRAIGEGRRINYRDSNLEVALQFAEKLNSEEEQTKKFEERKKTEENAKKEAQKEEKQAKIEAQKEERRKKQQMQKEERLNFVQQKEERKKKEVHKEEWKKKKNVQNGDGGKKKEIPQKEERKSKKAQKEEHIKEKEAQKKEHIKEKEAQKQEHIKEKEAQKEEHIKEKEAQKEEHIKEKKAEKQEHIEKEAHKQEHIREKDSKKEEEQVKRKDSKKEEEQVMRKEAQRRGTN